MALQDLLSVRLRGRLTDEGVTSMRDALGLDKMGRLTDREDWEFGYRYLNDDGAPFVVVTLWRYEDDLWGVTLSADPQASVDPSDVQRWRQRAEGAGLAAGLAVE